jgi:hypothetical protein
MADQADDIQRAPEPAEAALQGRKRDWLRLSSNLAIGVSLVGIPWTYLQPNGWGLTFTFVGFFVALMLRYVAANR